MKRTLAFMLALVLICSLSITAFAADSGSITISHAAVGQTYNLYKIFDATYATHIVDGEEVILTNEEGVPVVAYKIDTENQFFDAMFGENGTAAGYFIYDAETHFVTKNPSVTDANLFAYLKGLVEAEGVTPTETAENVQSEVVNFTGLETGYYVIQREDEQASAVTITTTKPHADVIDKNQLPGQLEKVIDGADENFSVSVGETINWTITFVATHYHEGNKVLDYTLKDTVTPENWAEIDLNSIVVKVNGTELAKGTGWDFAPAEEGEDPFDFKINIPWVDADEEFIYDDAIADVEVTYSAVVTDAAAVNDPATEKLENKAVLSWTTTTPHDDDWDDDETETKIFNLGVTKVDGDTNENLDGAQFTLYYDEACEHPVLVAEKSAGVYVVDPNGTELFTTTDGKVVIKGLKDATYYLKEIVAPDGYNKLAGATTIELSSETAADFEVDGTTYTVYNETATRIVNNQGTELPSTGGKGTMMLITFGTMIAVAFAILMITQKKMSIYND